MLSKYCIAHMNQIMLVYNTNLGNHSADQSGLLANIQNILKKRVSQIGKSQPGFQLSFPRVCEEN